MLVALLAACSSSELALETYEIGTTTRVRTHCAAADPVLASPQPDALPKRGQTELTRVEAVLVNSEADLLATYSALEVVVVPRNGQVWTSAGSGLVSVVDAADYQILVTIPGDGLCPTAPESYDGIPVGFFREGFLD